MSLLSKVKSGVIQKPYFFLLYGVEGVGKTTFASKFEKPLFLSTEEGTNHLDVERLESFGGFEEIMAVLDELLAMKHNYKSLIIDSLDHLELLVWDAVCKEGGKNHISDFGYGSGYAQALKKWNQLGDKLKELRNHMNVILIAHSLVKGVNDPTQPESYDRYMIKLHQKAADYFKEIVDAILFANFEVYVAKDKNQLKAKAFGEGVRKLYTMARPAHEGKNRYGLPYEMEMDAELFKKLASQSSQSIETLQAEIEGYLPQIKDAEKQKAARDHYDKNKTDKEVLHKILEKLRIIVETN